jgi:hypothetical protein
MKIQSSRFMYHSEGGFSAWQDQQHDERFRIVPSDGEPLLAYIAGPFSGKTRADVDANIARAVALGLEVAKLGVCPMIPHANTAHPEFEHVQPYQFWIAATMAQLRRCDIIVMVDGWERSSGATGEHAEAQLLKMPTFYTVSRLADWLSERRAAAGITASVTLGMGK